MLLRLPSGVIFAMLDFFSNYVYWYFDPIEGLYGTYRHRRELPVLRYHKILVIYPYPFFGGNYPIVLLNNIINDCICIITALPR